jgi:tRNA G26 N,N-dimethylase Trm1
LPNKYFEQNIEIPENIFYNPNNWIDREILKNIYLILKPKGFLDLTSSSGIRSKIISKVDNKNPIICNDISKIAYSRLKENIRFLVFNKNITNLETFHKYTNPEMLVDLDPFGSSEPYLKELSKLNCKYFSICFTDVINLCSVKRKDYILKTYNIKIRKVKSKQELALRIIISKIIQVFNRLNKKVIILFSYTRLHYLKVFFKVKPGLNFNYLKTFKSCHICKTILNTKFCHICKSESQEIGKLYKNRLYSLNFIKKLNKQIQNKPINKLLSKFNSSELKYEFQITSICKFFKLPLFKKLKLIKYINKFGICYESPFDKNILKTNLSIKRILKLITSSSGFEPEFQG